ncbi:MAG: hypothetical protein HYR72_10370 [Deltaproteobacteria bacterium]|nr:hypothetical protein [Deltaproteobacteria bacterium]MBI3388105.1 hypothetical protein [Deltaproteobacteria bacterium]
MYFVVTSCSPTLGFMACEPGNTDGTWWLGIPCKPIPHDCNVLCDEKDLPPDATHPNGAPNPQNDLPTGSTIQIQLSEVAKKLPNRYGFAYGTLVVPFKFQLTGAHQLTGSATLGPYLGYRFDAENYGLATTLAVFGGISNISVAKTTTDPATMMTSTSTQQIAGFGYGGACMLEVKGGFQAGAVLGFDSVGSNQGFQYNNKPWLALELGYSFSQ